MKTTMSKMVAIVFAVVVSLFLGCSKIVSPEALAGDKRTEGIINPRSDFQVDYVIGVKDSFPSIIVAVKGKSARLAVILSTPNGDPGVRIIEREYMLAGSATVDFMLQNPKEGAYSVIVKIIEPEKVIYKKDFTLTLGDLTIGNIDFVLQRDKGSGNLEFNGIELSLAKKGNIPVKFSDCQVTVNGEKWKAYTDGIFISQSDKILVEFLHLPTTVYPETQLLVKGKLFINGSEEQFVEFEKEIMVPGGSVKPEGKKSVKQEAPLQEVTEEKQGEVVSSPPMTNLRQLMTHK